MAKSTKSTLSKKQAAATTAKSSFSESQSRTLPPPPFNPAPQLLQPFLEPLSPKHVYLIHLDTHPKAHKRQIFLMPLFLDIAILAIILLRIYTGYTAYVDILTLLVGQNSPARVNTSITSWGELASIVVRRTLTFIFDYLLLTIFLPWPVRFLFGPAHWRYKIGFQIPEVVVRKSRSSWSDSLQPLVWIREDDETIKTKILSAVTPQRLLKTGYLLIDADWDLDFTAMVKAHELVGQDRLKFDDFKTAVLVHGGRADGMDWLVWKVEEEKSDASSSEEKLSDSQRDKIVMFQEKLAAMGKEDLFFRWVELIQYESTQPGGFTPERQRKAMQETKQLFEEQGVDFEKFWADVGGMEGIDM
ncbi:hypothetical protein GX48_00367 [Paracoccidioides brasiliensis]|nr:hypothetical protein GX48_00367 [Paracoccidioides brasiliensis]